MRERIFETKKMKSMLVTLIMLMAVAMFSLTASASNVTLKLNKTAVTRYVGFKYNLKATVSGTKKPVTWTSSNKSVATVNKNGVVTPLKKGKATITAKVAGVSRKCVVTVIYANDVEKVAALDAVHAAKALGLNTKITSGSTVTFQRSRSNKKVRLVCAAKNLNVKSAWNIHVEDTSLAVFGCKNWMSYSKGEKALNSRSFYRSRGYGGNYTRYLFTRGKFSVYFETDLSSASRVRGQMQYLTWGPTSYFKANYRFLWSW